MATSTKISVSRLLRIIGRVREDIKEIKESIVNNSYRVVRVKKDSEPVNMHEIQADLEETFQGEISILYALCHDEMELKNILDEANLRGSLMENRRLLEEGKITLGVLSSIPISGENDHDYYLPETDIKVFAMNADVRNAQIKSMTAKIRKTQDIIAEQNAKTLVEVEDELLNKY